MARVNLATRPAYNVRLVRLVCGALIAGGATLSVFDAVQWMRLRGRDADVRLQAEQADREARRLQADARQVRQSVNGEQLAATEVGSAEANQLIGRRTFSWTRLLNQFESTLPAGVRIASITPQLDQAGRLLVAVAVVSRRVEDLDGFIEALEASGGFSEVLSRQEEAQEDGMLRSVIQGYYKPAAVAHVEGPVSAPPPSSATAAGAGAGR
ncbi:MAG: hypothetical protein FJW29_04960 [Acidobacteria bacterium]|nr:hypothetical protein [Acidobacteriota bacterium]